MYSSRESTMKYSREQDIAAIKSCVKTGHPKMHSLNKRLIKKYGAKSMYLVITALFPFKKKKNKK
jgi:hypothetical protein